MISKPNKHIRAAWDRFSNTGEMERVSLDEVRQFIEQRGLAVELIEEVTFGSTLRLEAIHLKTNVGSALYPRKRLESMTSSGNNISWTQNYEHFWHSVDWFIPPFLSRGQINKALDISGFKKGACRYSEKLYLQQQFEPALSSIYTLDNIVPITVQTLGDSVAIGEHLPIIKEAILAFYSGMKIVAIAALIPIIEDALGSIIGETGSKLDTVAKVHKAINLAIENVIDLHMNEAEWMPPEYIEIPILKLSNERILILETIRYWLINSFYADTETYSNHSGFNRHIFAHATSSIWQNTNNFFRAMGLIQALAFIECFAVKATNLSFFCPTPDNRAHSFRLEIEACLAAQVAKKKVLGEAQIANHLPHNPIATDDGWLQRAAILSEKMNSQIILKLRDKGWQCHSFSDPIKEGEYVTVRASKGESDIKIALLYSCATGNPIFKHLDETCDVILYQGSYYHQGSYGYGIETTILPLSAWIPPE